MFRSLLPLRCSGFPVILASLITHLLFESPAVLVAVALLTAMMLLFIGWRRASRGHLIMAAWAGVAAGAAWTFAALVTTDREWLIDQTRRLVQLTAPLDEEQLKILIDPAAQFVSVVGQACADRPHVLDRLVSLVRRYPIESHSVRQIGAEVRGCESGASWLKLRTKLAGPSLSGGLEATGGMVPSEWRLDWQRQSGDVRWRIVRIQCVRVLQMRPECGPFFYN